MYTFALKPKWIAAHLGILVFVGTCGVAANWQLHRLHQRRVHNRLVRSRETLPPAPIDQLSPLDASDAYRRVTLTGTYREPEAVLLGRSQDERAGNHLLAPLQTTAGVILVDRGWVPVSDEPLKTPGANAPTGVVSITGILLPSEGGLGTRFSGTPSLSTARVNLDAFTRKTNVKVEPLYLLLQAQQPSQPVPEPASPETLNDGPHLSYTVQWILFAVIALVGWALFLRHAARAPTTKPT